jgi:hypothetical protein
MAIEKSISVERVELEKECYAMILDGSKLRHVVEYLMAHNLTKDKAHNMYRRVVTEINEIRDTKLPTVVNIHLERYEELYAKCVKWGMELQAMTVLHAKENLLGMIKDADRHSIYNFKNKDNLVLNDDFYDLATLDQEKNERLHGLLEKIGMTDGYKQIGN